MKIYENRNEMLSVVKHNGIIAELCVLNGDFSDNILKMCKPKELFLIDTWNGKVTSGDENGNNIKSYDGESLFKYVKNRFDYTENVTIIKDKTDIISTFDDNFFDFIYIDADHSYNGCLKDLQNCFKKVKNGGWIMLHDYEVNNKKTDNNYNFGVKDAVTEFCKSYNQKIFAKALDGCVSVAIKIKK